MATSWHVVEFRGRHGLRQLESDWRRLLLQMPDRGPQHAFENHLAHFTHFCGPDDGITGLALTDGERVRAICPLRRATVDVFRRSTSCQGLMCWDDDLLLDVICPADEAQRELLPNVVRFLRTTPSRPQWLVFDRVLEDSALWRCLEGFDARSFCERGAAPTDVVRCDRPFDAIHAGLSKNFRGNLRKARNKLALLADVRFETADSGPELERSFEAFIELEASGWKGEAGTRSDIKRKPDQFGYHHDLATTRWDGGRCEINTLHAEGVCLAAVFCLWVGGEYVVAKIAYDERYARCAPGQLLVEKTLERCCQRPDIHRMNLTSDAQWHRDWRPEAIPCHSVYIGLGAWTGPPLVKLLQSQFRYGRLLKDRLERSPLGARLLQWRRDRRLR